MDIKEWIRKEIEKGEDVEVIKGAVEILGFDDKIVEEVFKEIKKEVKKEIKTKKTNTKSKKLKDENKEKVTKSENNKNVRKVAVKDGGNEDHKYNYENKEGKDIKTKEHYLKEEPIEVLEFHVPKELETHHEEYLKKSKEIRRYVVYLMMFMGISLVLIGAYLYYYLVR